MILVTGAGGKTGLAVISALLARNATASATAGLTVRAAVRRPEQADALLALGVADAVVGDMRSRDVLQRACHGVDVIYHITPNMRPDEVSLAQLLLRAAQANGCRRIVYHSVLHPHTEEMPHHWQKLRVEEMLFKTGLDYTILQPAAYMQNLLAYRRDVVAEGRLRVPYPTTTRLGMVDLDDVAAVAARVLTEEGHAGAIYELAGSEIVTQDQIAQRLGDLLGRPVVAQELPRAQWESQARAAGLDAYAVDTLLRMFDYYARYGFYGNPTVLRLLLGRTPTSLDEFLRRHFG